MARHDSPRSRASATATTTRRSASIRWSAATRTASRGSRAATGSSAPRSPGSGGSATSDRAPPAPAVSGFRAGASGAPSGSLSTTRPPPGRLPDLARCNARLSARPMVANPTRAVANATNRHRAAPQGGPPDVVRVLSRQPGRSWGLAFWPRAARLRTPNPAAGGGGGDRRRTSQRGSAGWHFAGSALALARSIHHPGFRANHDGAHQLHTRESPPLGTPKQRVGFGPKA